MADMKESISIVQVHDNADRFVITRTTVEEVNSETLLKIYEQISAALEDGAKKIDSLPKEVAEREKLLRQEYNMLKEREGVFKRHAFALEKAKQLKQKVGVPAK